jgi:hypothetical protein
MLLNGVVLTFEDHPYCGPTLLNQSGDPAKHQPLSFRQAATQWAQQGRQVKDGFAVFVETRAPRGR